MKLILCSLGFAAVLFGQAPQGSIIPTDGASPGGAAGGDLTGAYPNPTIAAGAVALAKQAALAANSFQGNNTGSSATPIAMTVAQAKTLLALACGDLSNASALCSTIPGASIATFLATPSSANLISAVTDETGSGSLVFGTSPTGSGTATWPRFISPNVALTDNGTTIATDASLSNNFRIGALTANVTLSNPTNSTDGQVATWEVIQNAAAAKTLAFGTNFGFGAEITACTISAGLSSHSFITAAYNSTTTKWYVRGCITGY